MIGPEGGRERGRRCGRIRVDFGGDKIDDELDWGRQV
jgi:hypothetical protein